MPISAQSVAQRSGWESVQIISLAGHRSAPIPASPIKSARPVRDFLMVLFTQTSKHILKAIGADRWPAIYHLRLTQPDRCATDWATIGSDLRPEEIPGHKPSKCFEG